MAEQGSMKRWLSAFGSRADKNAIQNHVLAEGNYLWHVFSYELVPCLEGDEARVAFDALEYTKAKKFRETHGAQRFSKMLTVGKLTAKDLDNDPKGDIYIVAEDYSWTYVRTHERDWCGPYFCTKK